MVDLCPATHVERILLSTDGSEFSEGAVREAIGLAKGCGSTMTVLSVIESNAEFGALAPQLMESRERAARQNVDAVKAMAEKEGIACDAVVREGEDTYQCIIDEAAAKKCTLIVMGRRGRTGLKRLMMGSVTARVIGHATCNVLVVPRAARLAFNNIVVATDGSRFSAAAASEAVGLAKQNKGILTVISAVPSDIATPMDIDFTMNQQEHIAEEAMREAEKNVRAVKEAAQKVGVEVKAFVMTGRPADAIIETAEERAADLIVLGSHGRTGVERLLMGSVTDRVIVLASRPVLVVKTGA